VIDGCELVDNRHGIWGNNGLHDLLVQNTEIHMTQNIGGWEAVGVVFIVIGGLPNNFLNESAPLFLRVFLIDKMYIFSYRDYSPKYYRRWCRTIER